MQIVERYGITTVQTRQNNIKPILFYPQKFSSTTDAPITNNEENTLWTPNTIEITRYFKQDLPESYTPSVSDQDNYHCLNCYENTLNYFSDDFKDNSDFQKNSNSVYSIEPSISIPNYDSNYASDVSVSDYEIHKD